MWSPAGNTSEYPATRDAPWAASQRFGSLAYLSPEASWPTLPSIAKQYDVTINPTGDNTYQWLSNRVKGRVLGDLKLQGTYANQQRVNPYTADRMLDYKDYLDRVDPNRYHYDLRGLTRQTQAPYTPYTQARPQTQTAEPAYTGVAAESIQQNYKPYENYSRYYG